MTRHLKPMAGFRNHLILILLLIFCGVAAPAFSDFTDDLDAYMDEAYAEGKRLVNEKQMVLPRELLAKAVPDECFYGIADPENPDQWPEAPNVYDPDYDETCHHNKVNQAYIWGMTKVGDDIWFGTGPNVHCLVTSNYLGVTESYVDTETLYACEFDHSRYLLDLLDEIPDLFTSDIDISQIPMEKLGDWRPPRIFTYNTKTKRLVEKTPLYIPFLGIVYTFPETLVNATIGLRSAGCIGNLVFLAGPSGFGGIDIYAFDNSSGDYLGYFNFNSLSGENVVSINNIRKWLAVDNTLYTTIGVTYANGTTGGKVLRWTGSFGNPFRFEVVGTLDSSGAELVYHEGRMFVSTWSGGGEMGIPAPTSSMAGIFMSPVIPDTGLTASHKDSWTKVWSVDEYESNPLVALTYGSGALASYDGYLYWGTMHVPFLSFVTTLGSLRAKAESMRHIYFPQIGTRQDHYAYDRETYASPRNRLLYKVAERAISIFRGRNFGEDSQEIDFLYGNETLPYVTLVEDPIIDETGEEGYVEDRDIRYIAAFGFLPNSMGGASPDYGPAGLGNPFNNYTWELQVFNDELYLGTMNSAIFFTEEEPPDDLVRAPSLGANLFRFPSAQSPAVAVNVDGLGNYSNYGIRTMISDDALYLGTANPMNILVDEDGNNIGGWELIKMGNWISSPSGKGRINIRIDADDGTPRIHRLRSIKSNSSEMAHIEKPDGIAFPDGLLEISISELAHAGDTVYVTVEFPSDYPEDAGYYKLTDKGLEEFVNPDGSPRYAFSGNTVTLTLTDGDDWDKDGQVDGKISDPGGATVYSDTPEPGSSSSSSGGCFISSVIGRILN